MPQDPLVPDAAATGAADVCVIGSANLDLVATTERLPQPGETVLGDTYAEHAGGKGLNQAVAAARAGARTSFCAAVGDDDAARQLLEVMAGDGIDVAAVQRMHGVPTGRALIGVSVDGENSIIVVAGANAALAPEHVTAAGSARVVLAQLEVPLPTVQAGLAAARHGGAITILNPAPATPLPAELVALCDVLIPNEHEVEILGGLPRLFELGARAVVVTLGGRGAKLCTPEGAEVHVPAFPVNPIDTTGAGDAFCGAFAASLASGATMPDALRFAAAAGALATTRAGAVPSIARRAEIDALLSGGG
jgi:ribokinase